VIVLLITLWFGFWQATATSFAAVACLAYFFAPPILSFHVADPDNAVALAAFEWAAVAVRTLPPPSGQRDVVLMIRRGKEKLNSRGTL
jgi:two-component system, OmpR family, sensor histidine kinase KdpD